MYKKKVKKPAYANREDQYANVLRSMPPLAHTPEGYDAATYDISTQSEVVAWLHDHLSQQQIDQALFDFCINLKGALPDGSGRLAMIERATVDGRSVYRGIPRDAEKPPARQQDNEICNLCNHCVSPGVCDCGTYGRNGCDDFD